MKPITITKSEIAKHLGLTVDYISKIMKWEYNLHRKHNRKTLEFYRAKRLEIDKAIIEIEESREKFDRKDH